MIVEVASLKKLEAEAEALHGEAEMEAEAIKIYRFHITGWNTKENCI